MRDLYSAQEVAGLPPKLSPEGGLSHLRNAQQVLFGMLDRVDDPVTLAELGAIRKRLDAVRDILDEGRDQGARATAYACKRWLLSRLS